MNLNKSINSTYRRHVNMSFTLPQKTHPTVLLIKPQNMYTTSKTACTHTPSVCSTLIGKTVET